MPESSKAISRAVEDNGRAIRLSLTGGFDPCRRRDLHRALFSILTRRRPINLKLDMSAVTSISGECIHTLLAGYVQALRAGHGYAVVNPGWRVRPALQDSGLCAPAAVTDLATTPPESERDPRRRVAAGVDQSRCVGAAFITAVPGGTSCGRV